MKKILDSGTMIFSKAPDECPVGYEATSDPKIFIIKLEPCLFRDYEQVRKPCCGTVKLMFCKKFARRTTRVACSKCTDADDGGTR